MSEAQQKREQLIGLVRRIQSASGCITDLDALITRFENSVNNPSASQLIFDSPSGKAMTPEEIVDQAMAK